MNHFFNKSNQKTNEVKEVTINVFGEPIVFQYTVEEMENKLLPNNKLDETSKKLFAAWGIKIDPEKKARDLKIKHIHSRIEDIKLNIKVLGAKDGIELYEGSYGADIISKKAREVFGENIAFSYVDSENVKNKLKEQEKELAEIEKDFATVTVIIKGETKTLPAPKKLPKVNPLKKLKPLKKEANVEEKIIVTLNLDSIGFDRKPTGKEIGAIQNRLDNNISTIDIEEFAKAVALEGRTFKAAAVEGKTNHDWLSQDIFAIDIDNEYGKREKEHPYLSMEDAYKRCEKYNVMPIFIYPSFSSTPEFNKYRLVFRVPTTVTDLRVRRFILLALMEIFPERDKSCIDATRTFFGGCQELYKFDPKATINPLDLNFSIFQYLNDTKKTNSSSAIKNFCKRTGLNMFNGIPDIRLCNYENIINDGNLYIYKYRDERILLNFNIKEDEISNLNNKNDNENSKSKFKINNIKGETKELIQHFDFEQLENNCQLWHDLVNGVKLEHNEIFSMSCSMWRVKGAEKRMIEAINNNSDYGYKQGNKIQSVTYCRKREFEPVKCSNFCPYYDSCDHRGLMLHAVNNKRGNIRKLEVEEERITREAAEVKLEAFIKEALESKENEIVIIDGCTGIGKTTALGNSRDLLRNTCIAYPSHKLGKDIQERLNLDAVYCKELELSNEKVLNSFHLLQSIGDYSGAFEYLNEYKKICSSLDTEAHKKDIENIEEYKNINKDVSKTDKTILCTHTKALLLEKDKNNINQFIFDEDVFLNSCFKTIDFDFKEVNNAIMEAENKGLEDLKSSLEHLRSLAYDAKITPETVIVNNIASIVDEDEIKKLYSCNHNRFNPNIKINIKELLTCKYFKSNDRGEVLGAYIQKLPNKKCIILSATANEKIYKAAFPNRKVTVKNIGLVEEVGETVLHYKSFSRSSLTNDFEKHVNIIKKEAPKVKNIITFATKEKEFKKEGFNPIAHFGNCTGLDAYKGQDLIVIGTPHVDSRVYILMAKLLKKDIVIESSEFNYSNIIRNGFEFSINTFNEGCGEDTELLREIQAYFLESELVQAVGRARTLRTNATVHLFSNYPLKGCELYSA
ncbi:hypothetical protein LI043_09715 [Clostridium perfringens]|uniref:hypothetical protein n=1 Tax=Clostridium perfringens TaxID=1502 RepID=UPI00210943D3|nr:hypothetical protein [Clostridium perfringens]MCX0388946.1 hypothetical protein [Clostridium perfringens]